MLGDDYKILSDTTNNGVRHITAEPSVLVCSAQIDFDLVDGKIHNLQYVKGCNGNLQGIGKLVEGMDIDEVISRVEGIRCGARPTSCPDQLSKALKQAKEQL